MLSDDEYLCWAEELAPSEVAKVLKQRDKVVAAAKSLLADVRRRYPGEELRCEFMRALDEAVGTP